MVELEFKGMCKGCKGAELELNETEFTTIENGTVTIWKVNCVHEQICMEWAEKLMEERTKNV